MEVDFSGVEIRLEKVLDGSNEVVVDVVKKAFTFGDSPINRAAHSANDRNMKPYSHFEESQYAKMSPLRRWSPYCSLGRLRRRQRSGDMRRLFANRTRLENILEHPGESSETASRDNSTILRNNDKLSTPKLSVGELENLMWNLDIRHKTQTK